MPIQSFRRCFAAAILSTLFLTGLDALAKNATEARLRRDLAYLASDACEGRGPGTKGIDLAADFIASQFKEAGLKPAGEDGGYFQPFTVSGESKKSSPNTLSLKGPLGQVIELREGKDFEVLGVSGKGKVTAPIVFVGYGSTIKDKYDDYKGIDVKGKVVLLLRHTPRWNHKEAPFDNAQKNAALVTKQALAEANHAAAILLVNDRSEDADGDKLMPFEYVAKETTPGAIPSVQVRRSTVDAILRSSLGTSLVDMEVDIDRDLLPRSTSLPGWTANLQTTVTRTEIPVKNVIGVLEGSGPLAKETVIVGAHYDHLGYGGRNSLDDKNKKTIHYGADDNASGTAALLELARIFGQQQNRQGRRLVFMAFSAEEMGLLGSRHYCEKQPIFPLADTVAMVNLDMVGRMQDDSKSMKGVLTIQGVGTAKSFRTLVETASKDFDFQIVKKDGGIGPSDHASFYRKEIPVLFFFTGTHKDYHRPSDTAEKINYTDMVAVTDLAERITQTLATEPKRPEYVKVAGEFTPTMPGNMPKLGIMPNYASEKKGVLVGGVKEGGPAEKGGLKAGDEIVEIGGKQVTSIENYMVIMSQQRANQPLEIGILRDGKKLTLKVIPQ